MTMQGETVLEVMRVKVMHGETGREALIHVCRCVQSSWELVLAAVQDGPQSRN